MGKQQSVRKIIVDIILILFIPVFYLYIAQQYNRYNGRANFYFYGNFVSPDNWLPVFGEKQRKETIF